MCGHLRYSLKVKNPIAYRNISFLTPSNAVCCHVEPHVLRVSKCFRVRGGEGVWLLQATVTYPARFTKPRLVS